jgi:hypothetical protein
MRNLVAVMLVGLGACAVQAGCGGTAGAADAADGSDGFDAADPGPDGLDSSDASDPGPADDGGQDDAGSDAGDGSDAGLEPVLPEDVILLPPDSTGRAILATITGYEMTGPCDAADDPGKCEIPLYRPYTRDSDAWWDNLVEELLHSRVHVIMAHGRGCFDPAQGDDGNGNMCPRLLRHLVAAIDRAGARDVLRLGMFDDTGAYPGARNSVDNLPWDTPFDLADPTSWRFFWDHNMKIWFDTVPPDLWFRMDGRPIIAFWSLADAFFTNQQGNASALLRDLRAKFQDRYGEDPLFILDQTWITEDSTITLTEAAGVNDWFEPPVNNYTYRLWGGAWWGAAVPAYRNPNSWAGCGVACREVLREDGDALRRALAAGQAARLVLLEGFTNIAESAGFYRSTAWRLPNLYLNVIRDFADPGTPTLRFEAEAADRFSDSEAGNQGGAYRDGDLDVGALAGHGWFVGWTSPGEWIEFAEVALGCGHYRFTARVSNDGQARQVHLEIDGIPLPAVPLPSTGGWDSYTLVHLGSADLTAGTHDLRFVFDTGLTNLDWFFSRKASGCPPVPVSPEAP